MMETANEMTLVEQTVVDVAQYSQLQLEKLKLRLLDNFSTLFNNIFAVLVIVILASFALLCLAIAGTWCLGELIGSYLWAVAIMGGAFMISAIVVFACRRRLIINQTVKMLSRILFENDKSQQQEDDDE
ncbi:hypothetical protein FACS1894159_03870 [Bacteroidia bacterium]|nr:hypothetical protein FACS1894159_03870 [Bacteroidia bacterium]